jgi:hypothetical protein
MAEDWARRIWRESEQANAKAARKGATLLARQHESLIESGKSPSGGSQKPNGPGYAKSRRKQGKQPLWLTGSLKRESDQRIRVSRETGSVSMEPPSNRAQILEELHEAGFETVYQTVPDSHDDELQSALDDEQARVRPA